MVALVSMGPGLDTVARRLLAVGFDEVIRVEGLSCSSLRGNDDDDDDDDDDNDDASRFETACTKLHIFNLTQFRSVVYLDADALVVHESATTLFDYHQYLTPERPFAAAPEAIAPTLFNTGVLVVLPGAELFATLQGGLEGGSAYDSTDQGYLNGVFPDWFSWSVNQRLSPRFNFAQMVADIHAPAAKHYEREGDGIAVMHFLGSDKPWLLRRDRDRSITKFLVPYYNMWARFSRAGWLKSSPRPPPESPLRSIHV